MRKVMIVIGGINVAATAVLLSHCQRVEKTAAPVTTVAQPAQTAPTTSEPDETKVDAAPMPTEQTRVAEELWSVHPLEPKLVGRWDDIEGKPLPTVEFFNARPGSRTPWNITFQTTTMVGGCGFDAAMDAWCAVYEDNGKSVPRRVKSTISILTNGSALRVTIEGLAIMDVVRIETRVHN